MLKLNNVSSASTPPANKVILYAKGGLIYKKGDDGIEQVLGGTVPAVIQDEGVSVTPRTKLNFAGAGVFLTDNGSDTTTVNITGSSSVVPAPRTGWFQDPGAMQLLMRRSAVNPEDDHFDAGSLNAKWSRLGVLYGEDYTGLPGWMGFGYTVTGSVGLAGITQPFPTGVDFSIETELIWASIGAVGWGTAGLILTDGIRAEASNQVGWMTGGRNSAGLGRFNITKYVNGVYSSNYLEVLSATTAQDHQWLKIIKVGSTYYFYESTNGLTWQFIYSANTGTLGVTPTRFGLYTIVGNAVSYFNYFLRY
jgi:hypothetical protein